MKYISNVLSHKNLNNTFSFISSKPSDILLLLHTSVNRFIFWVFLQNQCVSPNHDNHD